MRQSSHHVGAKRLKGALKAGVATALTLGGSMAHAQDAAPPPAAAATTPEAPPPVAPPVPGGAGPVTDVAVTAEPQQSAVQAPPAVEARRLNPTGRDVPLTAPLRDGVFILGEIDFVLGADDSVRVNAPRLTELLRRVLAARRAEEIEAALAGQREVTVARLAELGYPVRYDPETIGLVIDIPAGARTTQDLALAQLSDDLIGEVDQPAGFSGYINFRSSFDYVWQGLDQGFQDPFILLDSAFRLNGVVFENEATTQLGFSDNGRTRFIREGTRFVYDDFKTLARWTAGDLLPTARGFSGTTQMSGVSIVRSYSTLQPQRNVQPRGERTFTIVRPSTVEAFINGQPVRQIRLQPGTYNVRDFPFTQGSNDVRLVVTDDAGVVETIEFSLFFDRTLLAPGITEFALFGGVRSPTIGRSRDYRFDEPAASGFIRRGVNERLTAGANFQAQRRGVVVGGEIVAATNIGTIGGDLAVSTVDNIGTGYAVNVGIQRNFGGSASVGRAVGLTFEHRSRNFATPNDLIADNRFDFELGATYSQALSELQFISVTGRYGKGRDAFDDEVSARVTYGYRLSPRLNLAAEAVYEDRQIGRRDYGVRLTLTYRFDQRSTGIAEVDTRFERARFGYQTSRGDGVGAWSASGDVDVDYGNGLVGLDGSATYTANRADIGFSHATAFSTGGGSITDQRSSFRLGTAIALAENKLALSRPIFDSFAMVAPHPSLGKADVYVDPREGRYSSKSGVFGPAVEPDLSSYADRVVSYDVPDAPVGYDLGRGNFRVFPPYRSGYMVVAGSDYSVTGVGTLYNQNGTPVSLLAGRAFEVANPDRAPVTVFTNRGGRFGIQGLRPGQWRIEMPTEPAGSVIIDIPEGTQGVIRLGDVKLGAGQ